jgi:hypothetical protein
MLPDRWRTLQLHSYSLLTVPLLAPKAWVR